MSAISKQEKEAVLKLERCEKGSKALVHKKSTDFILITFSALLAFAILSEISGNITGVMLSREVLNIIIAIVLLSVGGYVLFLKTIYQKALLKAAIEYKQEDWFLAKKKDKWIAKVLFNTKHFNL